MVLNNDKAINAVMKENNPSLNAAAGLTVVNWRKMAQGTVGIGDVVAWSGTKGLFGDVVAVGRSNIRFNQQLTDAFTDAACRQRILLQETLKIRTPCPCNKR